MVCCASHFKFEVIFRNMIVVLSLLLVILFLECYNGSNWIDLKYSSPLASTSLQKIIKSITNRKLETGYGCDSLSQTNCWQQNLDHHLAWARLAKGVMIHIHFAVPASITISLTDMLPDVSRARHTMYDERLVIGWSLISVKTVSGALDLITWLLAETQILPQCIVVVFFP